MTIYRNDHDQVNLIHRNVCCWDRNVGGMGKINIENFIRSKHIRIIYKGIHRKC